jgi:uncharacterized protein (TIGR02391 family)
MPESRIQDLTGLLNTIADFKIDYNQYYEDSEPQYYTDVLLTGLVDPLLAFCRALGWSELVQHLEALIPIHGTASETLGMLHRFVVPEARRRLAALEEGAQSPTQWFWSLVHPRICTLARPRFEVGLFGDAVEASFKEFNDAVKRIARDTEGWEQVAKDGKDLDGANLMNAVFSVQRPLIRLTPLLTESDQNEQKGFMQIMAGSMTGIRNPHAHGNLNHEETKALHLICLASLLMFKLDQRV